MKPRIYIFLSLIFISFSIVCAQTPEGFDANSNVGNFANSSFRSFDNRYTGVEGYQTLFKDFVNGKITLSDGKIISDYELNYDVFRGELLVNDKKIKRIMAMRSDKLTSFSLISPLDGREMVFVKLPYDGPGFYEHLYGGKISLYKRYEKVLEKANFGGGYNTTRSRTSDEFVDSFSYRIKKEDGTVIDFKPQKNELLNLFSANKSKLTKYLKANKVKLKNDMELADVFAYMDK